jgi:hypothetical protein
MQQGPDRLPNERTWGPRRFPPILGLLQALAALSIIPCRQYDYKSNVIGAIFDVTEAHDNMGLKGG